MMAALTELPAWLLVAVLAVALSAEAGLLIGVFLPGGSAALLLGTTAVPTEAATAVAALASVTGGLYGLHRGRRRGTDQTADDVAGLHRSTGRIATRWAQLMERAGGTQGSAPPGVARSAMLAGVSQGFGGSRTLAPRALGARGVRPGVWLLGAAPAALVWGYLMVTAGDAGSAVLGRLDVPTAWVVPAAVAAAALGVLATRRHTAAHSAPVG